MIDPKNKDSFGFLFEKLQFSFEGGSVSTREDFVKARKWINSQTNKDGYLYPSTSYTVTKNIKSNKWRRIPKTSRPAKFFHIPPSHYITLTSPQSERDNRYGLSGFVVESLAFLFGTKLQFWDWFIEGRIPTKTQTINIALSPSDVEAFFQHAVPTWQAFDSDNKKRMSNLLFVHSVAGAVEWDWQRFMLEYMVTDACYRIAESTNRCRERKHLHRLNALCDTFGLKKDEDWFELFGRLRNDLFHETLWDGGRIFGAQGSGSFYAPLHLRRFNHRLVTAILCGPGQYTKSGWTSLRTYGFSVN